MASLRSRTALVLLAPFAVASLVFMLMTTGLAAGQRGEGVDILLGKARSLEARGRMDLAAQNWSQVLLVDPNQGEALAGLARHAKQSGDTNGLRVYLDRLRKLNPRDPAIASIERMRVLTPQDRARLDEAGRLATGKRPDEAMTIYREVFGAEAPWGKWAEPYYETLAAAAGGRAEAIARLRSLSGREPGNEAYRLWLARLLSYDPKTRVEALRLLETIRDSGTAEQARPVWRQALLWEKGNAAVLSSAEAYTKRYPDPELAKEVARLKGDLERADQEADKKRGFQALQGKDMATAQREFEDVLRRSPKDVNAMVGLGFVRLDQKRFDEAQVLFDKARALAPARADIREGSENAQYWSAMQRGQALQTRDADAAIGAYEAALALRPQDDQPVLAIAQIMLARENLAGAAGRFERVLKRSPSNAEAIIGLGFVRLKEKNFPEAVKLLGRGRELAPKRAEVENGYKAATFWNVMNEASAALDQGRTDAAMKGFEQALAIDSNSRDALLGLGGAAERLRKDDVALNAYERLAAVAPTEARAWMGLLRAQINSNQPDAAVKTVQRLPAGLREKLEARPDYLAQLSLVLFATKRESEGDRVLQQALTAAARADSDEALGVRLQIANILMQQGRADRAISIYTQATQQHPDNVIAWQGLVGAYAEQRDFGRAMSTVKSMPRATYDAASKSTGFLNAVAAGYAADGRCSEAESLLTRSLDLDRAAGRQPSPATGRQLADIWMRQRRYDRASQAYRTAIDENQGSVDAWRGYITALHNQGDDSTLIAASTRMPSQVRAELWKDAGILTMLAGAHARAGQRGQSVALLEQARAQYQAQGRTPPADLDLQLGWAMLESSRADDARDLVARVRARPDLTSEQRAALDEMWLSSVLSRVDAAMKRDDTDGAATLLTEAWRQAPQNSKLPSALAALYLRQNKHQRALEVYRAWGLQGAEAADYRAAAGAALAEHDPATADQLLQEGLQRWPGDRDLLRMNGRQAVSRGDYRDAEKLLKAALAAKPEPRAAAGSAAARPASPRVETSEPACTPDRASVAPTRVQPAGPRIIFASVRQASTTPASGAQTTDAPSPQRNDPTPQTPTQSPESPQTPAQADQTDQISDDLAAVTNRNTPFASVGMTIGGRAGDPGLSRLIVRDVAPGGSVTIGNTVRMGVDVRSLSLTSGTPDGLSDFRFGTLPLGARFAEQSASGYTAELQMSTREVGVTVGTPPSEFLVKTWAGGLRLGAPDAPVRLIAVRERVKDSLLSYAGVRDPGTGLVWGGVVANAASLQLSRDSSGDGVYLSVGGALLQGENVANNWSADANAGAYWTIGTGGPTSLTIGVAGTAMHYEKNLSFFSLGHGGYFSPQRYLLGSVPLSWSIRHTRVRYEMQASPGFQFFTTADAPYYPIGIGPAQPEPFAPLVYDGTRHTGANYNVTARLEYRIAPHVHLGAFGSANNTRDFDSRAIGVSLKLLANRLPATTNLRALAVPDWRGNQPLGN